MVRAEIARKRRRISDETIRPRFRPACREPDARSERDRGSGANGTLFASSPSSHRFVFPGEDGAARRDGLISRAADGRCRSMLDEPGSPTHPPGKVG